LFVTNKRIIVYDQYIGYNSAAESLLIMFRQALCLTRDVYRHNALRLPVVVQPPNPSIPIEPRYLALLRCHYHLLFFHPAYQEAVLFSSLLPCFPVLSQFSVSRKATINLSCVCVCVCVSVRPSVRLHGTTLAGFSRNLISVYFSTICWENASSTEIWKD
jgi:hypothetical protein